VVVIGIDSRRSPREIGKNLDLRGTDAKAPRLGVVPVRGERRIANEIA